MKGLLIALLVLIVGSVLVVAPYTVNVLNTEAGRRNDFMAKQQDNKNQYDNSWKQISQIAQVTNEDRASYDKLLTDYAQARSGTGDNQAVMKWIKEAVPNVDYRTMLNLQNTIISSRNSFARNQTELVDMAKEHNKPFDMFPDGIVLSMFGRQKVDAKLVTSTRTEKAFDTGVDDDVNVFNKG